MNLPLPEALLAHLLASPRGWAPPAAADGAPWRGARRELELRGHPIDTLGGGDWVLQCGTAHFDPSRFAARRPRNFGSSLEVWESLGSTNSRAWEGVAGGKPPGWVVLAEAQRAGRGRQGRRWVCPPHGGLLFSVVVPLNSAAGKRAPLFSLAMALGVCEALRRCTSRDIRLKWPNDLWLQERKLAGLLVEARPAVASCAVVGCGINVHVPASQLQALTGSRAVSLREDGAPLPCREEILAHVLDGMEGAVEDWQAARDTAILERWSALDVLQGRDIVARSSHGVERGRAEGITDTGLLRFRLPSGDVRFLAAGEVHLP